LQRQGISCFKTRHWLLKKGVSGIFLSGRAILARAEGEMTRLKEFSENAMLLYGMDEDPDWENRHLGFWLKFIQMDRLQVKYSIVTRKTPLTRNTEYCILIWKSEQLKIKNW
jgi:hypothetical protein